MRSTITSSAAGEDLSARAGLQTHAAEVLALGGHRVGAAQTLTEAVRLHEEKGNALPADRAARCRLK